jgi:hypothetical protein
MSIVPINRDEKDGTNVTSQDTCHLFKTMLSRYEAVVRAQKGISMGVVCPYILLRVSFITISTKAYRKP